MTNSTNESDDTLSSNNNAKAPIDVFISYARKNEDIARNISETLRSEGFEVWFDSNLYAGVEWESMLMDTLTLAKSVLVLWSIESVTRPWVLKEAAIAFETRRLVPVKLDDCNIPEQFTNVQTALMSGWSGSGHHEELERLLNGLSRLAPPSRIDTVRPGFDTKFLGCDIDLPAITGVADEFRYLHFSVVMNPARRLPWFVAYNMEPRVQVKRSNRWMPDPALRAAFQPSDDHYRATGFDRGHIAAAASVSWGTPRQAQLANHQAFFWTNTAPQHPQLNRGWWLRVEQWERDVVSKFGKAIGFSGPALTDDDPIHRDFEQLIGRLRLRQNFRLPKKFWKIVLVKSDDELRSAAFLLDQEKLLEEKMPECNPSQFRCGVEDIETLTGLDFGDEIRNATYIQ